MKIIGGEPMQVIICVDDHFGMMFNKRRQSKDIEVIKDILNMYPSQTIYMNTYSSILFPNCNTYVSDTFLQEAAKDDICFVENEALLHYQDQIQKLIVYHWNRIYPSDITCDLNFHQFKLLSTTEFSGNSHDKITKEIYINEHQ